MNRIAPKRYVFASRRVRIGLISIGLLLTQSAAGEGASQPHHLSVLLGWTELIDESTSGFTYGIDYEYAFTSILGVGFVAEYAVGDADTASVFAVVDIHLTEHFVLQVGPGFESSDLDDSAAFRVGGYWEFDIGEVLLSTTVSYDVAEEDDSVVAGFLIGKKF